MQMNRKFLSVLCCFITTVVFFLVYQNKTLPVFINVFDTSLHVEVGLSRDRAIQYYEKHEREDFRHVNKISKTQSSPEDKLEKICEKTDTNTETMTSLISSKVTLVSAANNASVIVKLVAYDKKQRPKAFGEDIIVVWAEQKNGAGRVSGQVTDHKNGSYTGNVKILWTGKATVYLKLISSIENTCLRWKAMKKYGNSVYALKTPRGVVATFKTNSPRIVSRSYCGPIPWVQGFTDLCNFTSLNGGYSWYCGKPTNNRVNCSNLFSFSNEFFKNISLDKGYVISDPGHGIFKTNVKVHVYTQRLLRQPSVRCLDSPPILSWTKDSPSGYWWNKTWMSLMCWTAVRHTDNGYQTCLKNKYLFLIGDSTVRQYAEYFIWKVLEKGKIGLKTIHGPKNTYHSWTPFSNHNISLWFFKHEMPFHSPTSTWLKNIRTVPDLISSIAEMDLDDRNIILLVYYNSHLSAHPPSVYRDRIRKLAKSLQSFIATKPRAKVFYKGFHIMIEDVKWFDARISNMMYDILTQEFKAIMDRVIYLDTQSITTAHNSELLHPVGDALLSQIQQFMSYVC